MKWSVSAYTTFVRLIIQCYAEDVNITVCVYYVYTHCSYKTNIITGLRYIFTSIESPLNVNQNNMQLLGCI